MLSVPRVRSAREKSCSAGRKLLFTTKTVNHSHRRCQNPPAHQMATSCFANPFCLANRTSRRIHSLPRVSFSCDSESIVPFQKLLLNSSESIRQRSWQCIICISLDLRRPWVGKRRARNCRRKWKWGRAGGVTAATKTLRSIGKGLPG